MANLFWKSKEATTRLVETPFRTEEEFERLIFATPEILEDIFLLKRQIRGGTKQGIPDIVGLDKDFDNRKGGIACTTNLPPLLSRMENGSLAIAQKYLARTGRVAPLKT